MQPPQKQTEPSPSVTQRLKAVNSSNSNNLVWFAVVIFLMVVFIAPGVMLTFQEKATQPAPPPLTYPDLPVPISTVDQQVPADRDGPPIKLHAGDTFITYPFRCITDDGNLGVGTLSYSFTRAMFDATTEKRVEDMPGGTNSAPVGCNRVRSSIQYVPNDAKPGTYYLGGNATAQGARRTATVEWRTANFEVLPNDPNAPKPIPSPTTFETNSPTPAPTATQPQAQAT
jgi:hypothetical protein